MKVIKREAVFIPLKELGRESAQRIKDKLTFHFYGKEKICDECEWLPERPNDICQTCGNFNGTTYLASNVVVGKNKYLKIPVGSSQSVLDDLSRYTEIKVVDKSPRLPIASIKFSGTLRPEQEEAVKVLLKKKRGGLSAPPRSGKTVMAAALTCRLGEKTLILASQRDWLIGFYETFVGSKTQSPLTDLDKSRIKLCKTLADFENHDICLATVQAFYSEGGQQILAKIRDMFPVIIVDEVHTSAAPKYAQIVSRLNSRILIGLSGTHDRKDGRFVLVENIFGPTVHELKTERLRPQIRLTRTGYSKSYKRQMPWGTMVSSLENDPKRLRVIAKQAVKDINAGHMVLIPLAQVKPIAKLVTLINEYAGRKVAYPFTGSLKKAKRDLYIEKAREYKIKSLVGTQKILSVGINIPRASMLYEVCLSSNLPNAIQRISRVLTPMPGKVACVRYFLDDLGVRRNCLRNEFFNVMKPTFNPVVSETDMQMLKNYFNGAARERIEL